jgi:ribose/xylose/arabinose/galactoside ABC-type transport system permease subunit
MFTPYGRSIYAVGENADAARLCGISVGRIKISTYVLSALLAVVAGLLASGYIGTTSMSLGNDYINNSLAAVLIGGNSIEGGKGGVWGGFMGAFFMMLLFALLTMINVGQAGKLVIQGIIIFGVAASQGVLENR